MFKGKAYFKRFIAATKSRNPAAYLGIAIKAIRTISIPIDLTISFLNDSTKNNYKPIKCVFIVGPQRSGATVIYQSLTRALPSNFIKNIHALFPNSGTRLLTVKCKRKLLNASFNNYYGYTSNIADVYEGNEFFKWISRVHYNKNKIKILRKRFLHILKMISNRHNEVYILKNARIFPKISLIHKAVPEVIFVRIRREASQIAQSVLRAYYELGSFHPIPDSLASKNIDDPLIYSCLLVREIEAELDKQLSMVSSNSKFEIQYENFCCNPWEYIETLAYKYLKLPSGYINKNAKLNKLKISRRRKVSENDRIKIDRILNKA